MPNYPSNIVDIIGSLQKDVKALQTARTEDATASNPPAGPNTPTLTITGLSTSVTYRTDPHTGGNVSADISVDWAVPTASTTDPIHHYEVSYQPSWSPHYTAATVTDNSSLTYPSMKLASSYTIRVRAVTKKGRLGPYATTSRDTGIDTTPPPQPSNPVVVGSLGGVSITWDGKDASGNPMPGDFAYIRMDAGFTAGFTPSSATLIATPGSAATMFVPANTNYDRTYAKFAAVDTKGNQSAYTSEVSALPNHVATSDLADGSISYQQIAFKNWGNLQADGSFEEAAQRDNIQNFATNASNFTNGCFSFVNNSTNAFHASWYLSATPSINTGAVRNVYLANSLTAMPVQSTDKYLLRVAWLAATGSNGSVTFDLRVVKGDGTAAASTTNITVNGSSGDGTWKTASGWITLPAGAAFATARIQLSAAASTGSWRFDAVELRRVVQTEIIDDAAITNAQIADATISNAKIGSVDAGKITTGLLDAARIDLGAGLNLNNHPDPSFESSRFRATYPLTGANWAYEQSISSLDGGWRIKGLGNGTSTTGTVSPPIRVMAGERFYVSIMAKTTSTTGTNTVLVRFYDVNDGLLSTSSFSISNSIGNNWTRSVNSIVTCPAQCNWIEVALRTETTSTDGIWYYDMIEIRQVLGSTTSTDVSRVEMSPLGIKMYDGSGTLTVSLDGTTGNGLFTGTVQSGVLTTEDRIILNPGSGNPEIRLYPASETVRYAAIRSYAAKFGAPAAALDGAELTGGDGYSVLLGDAQFTIGKVTRSTLEPSAVGLTGKTNQLDIYGQLPDHPTHSYQCIWGGFATVAANANNTIISYGLTMTTPTPAIVCTPQRSNAVFVIHQVVSQSSTGFTITQGDVNTPANTVSSLINYGWLAFRWITPA